MSAIINDIINALELTNTTELITLCCVIISVILLLKK